MKKLLLLCMILIAHNGFGKEFNPYQRPSLERSCYDLLQMIKEIYARFKNKEEFEDSVSKDSLRVHSFEMLPSEFFEKYKDYLGKEFLFKISLYKDLSQCEELNWFREEIEKSNQQSH